MFANQDPLIRPQFSNQIDAPVDQTWETCYSRSFILRMSGGALVYSVRPLIP